jgi:3-hydroxybutyryl-CoA dehydratase
MSSFASSAFYFDDVEVGQVWESQGRTITEADIVNFAGLSGDFNPIHIDHEFAKTTPFRRPIAHGLLVFSIGSGLGVSCPAMRTVAFVQVNEWNFRGPVFIGDTIHLRSKVLEKTPKGRGRRGELVWYRGVVNQEGKIVQEGKLVTLVECRALVRNRDGESDTATPAAAGPEGSPE